MGNAENASLHALFAQECDGHLHAIVAQREALASSDGARRAAAAHALDASLHTLAGAARAVDLTDLEYMCRALEALAHASAGRRWDPLRLALLDEAVALAPRLLDPVPRVRNQMLGLVSRCAAADAAQQIPGASQ